MPQFETTITIEAENEEEAEFTLNRIVENHNLVAYTPLEQVPEENEIETEGD